MEGTPQQPSVPAGWYPDPSGDGLRYWDGVAWTTHTAPAAGQLQQAEAAAPAQAPEASQAGAQAGAAQAGQAAASSAPPGTAGAPPGGQAAATSSTPAAAAGAAQAGQAAAASSTVADDDAPTTTEWALSIGLPLLPLIGLIWGLYLRRQSPAKETPGNIAILLSLVITLGVLIGAQLVG
jgi:hypothetical protein